MQTTVILDRASLSGLISEVFESGGPDFYLKDTDYGEEVCQFASAAEVDARITATIEARGRSVGFAIHFPETRGYTEKERVGLDPRRCKGHTFRYSIQGWGVIFLQLDFYGLPEIECYISCNSQKRAEAWSDTYAELKSPDLWDWKAVERSCRRLIRCARDLSKRRTPPSRPPNPLPAER